MVDKKTWAEFRSAGLLWWINQILHAFGWAIVAEIDNDEIVNVYPARVKFRGFSENLNTEGYIKVSEYLKANADVLLNESRN